MSLTRGLAVALLGTVLVLTPNVGRAQEVKPATPLDLVPEDAVFAVMVRNLDELRERGDKFYEAAGMNANDDRPSSFVKRLFGYLKVEKGLDRKAALAVVVPNLKKIGLDQPKKLDLGYLINLSEHLVFIVPFDKLDDMAGNFGLKAGDFKPGVVKLIDDHAGLGKAAVAIKGKHLYLSFREKAVAAVVDARPLSGALAAAQRDTLAKADLSLMFGPKAGGLLWPLLLEDIKKGLEHKDAELPDKEVINQFIEALGEVRFVIAGIRLDDGLALDVVGSFPGANDGGARAEKFLSALRAGDGVSDLNGLPRVHPLLAYAAKGDGVRNVQLARTLVKIILNKGLGIEVQWTEAERKKFFADFDVMYQHLKGSRLVFYRTEVAERDRLGSVAAVAILDIDDTEAHLAPWPGVVELANSLGVKLAKDGRQTAPKFAYKAKAETINDVRVDVLSVEVPQLPAEVQKEYRKMLGPDWNKVRLAVLGKHVVVLVGSDVERLKETLSNLKTGNKGLAEEEAVTTALKQIPPDRKIEFHSRLEDFLAFTQGKGPRSGTALTSWALSVETDRAQFSMRVPRSGIKAFLNYTDGRQSAVKEGAALDLVPEDAAFAVLVRNLEELQMRGDKLLEAGKLRKNYENSVFRPAFLFPNLFRDLKVEGMLEEEGAAAAVLPNFKKVGIDQNEKIDDKYLITVFANMVYVLPIKDLDAIAKTYGIKADDLKGGAVKVTNSNTDIGRFLDLGNVVLAVKGKHLYLGHREKAVKAVLEGKPLSGALSEKEHTTLGKADIALHFGPKAGGKLWPLFLEEIKKAVSLKEADATDNEVVKQLIDALNEVRFVVVGMHLDAGLGLDVIASFPGPNDGGAKAEKFLSAVRGGDGASDLNGLPRVNPLLAYAAKGDGVRNVQLARTLVKIILNKVLGIEVLWTEEQRKKFFADFDVMYQHLKGSRLVYYRTPARDAETVGSVAAIAILDIDDTEAHLARWPGVVELANSLGVKLAKEGRETAPKFAYKAKAETIDGVRVDVLSVEVPQLPAEVQKQYRKLLGPDWNKVRLAVRGKHVVVLVGSDVARLKETLSNLKTGNKGLAEQKAVVDALKLLAPERKIEFHSSLQDFTAYLNDKPVAAEGKALTSWALSVESDRVQLSMRVPKADIEAIVKALGLSQE